MADSLPAANHGAPDHALERLVFFSDAVFAIAITLLVIELHPPHFERGASVGEQLAAFATIIPNLFGFVVSFWVIGAFWQGHHRAFALAAHYHQRLVRLNLAMLFVVAFMPFATAFMANNLGALVPTAFYNATMVILGLLNIRLVQAATSPPVVAEGVTASQVAQVRARGWGVVLGAATALVFSFVDARFSQMALITIPLWQRAFHAFATRT